MLELEIRFRVQHHPVRTFLGAVIVFRSLHVLPLGFSERKSVHVWVWEVYIATALIVDHYYGYRVHGWNWLTSHTWADTCRCPQSQTPSERVRVRRETCDLFCLNKVWLLQMNSNCWYYRVIRVTHTHAHREWPANTLRICHTHTRAVTETLQIYTSTHAALRRHTNKLACHADTFTHRCSSDDLKQKEAAKCPLVLDVWILFSINQIKPLMMMMSDCPQRVKIRWKKRQRFQSRVWNLQSNLNILCYRFFFFYWG